MANPCSDLFSEKAILCSICLVGCSCSSGKTQVLLCALQHCSGPQWCWGLCDLSMVALLYFGIACPSLISSRPKDMVWFHSGVHSFLCEGGKAKEYFYSRGNPEGKNLERSLHSPFQVN